MINPANFNPENGRAAQFAVSVIDRRASMPTALTLQFAPGQRPTGDDVARLALRAAESTKFAISHQPDADEGWIELIAMGLTFEASGLAPDDQAHSLAAGHFFGLEAASTAHGLEAVRLVPGPHLSSGRMLMPVLRVLCGLGAELARLPGLRAVGWEAASSWMAPAYFMSAVRAWLVGGAFPALGLTALREEQDGALHSEGLALFTGYEVRIESKPGETPQELAKLASRAIHHLVQAGPQALANVADPAGKVLHSEMASGDQLLRLWREA